ncbi:MAG: hypothetical protein PHY56_07710 [Candidatus Omnitrophica bacterium]|nr:hypothetical protein [Candidatus Omnitrophota bacterium]
MKIRLGQPSRSFPYFIYAAVIYYLFICILHLASRRPPWLDEILLINNLKELSLKEIFGQLRYGQGFPRIYLLIIYKLGKAFNYNVISLRILPFVFMLTGFGLWLGIFRKAVGRGESYLLFILSWCGSIYMTYYAAEFKQYSADVFAAGVFTYFILRQKESVALLRPRISLILQYSSLPFLVLFSYTGYFFIPVVLYNLLLLCVKNKKDFIYLMAYLLSALAVVFISYNLDLKHTLAMPGIKNYWKDYFISLSSPGGFLTSLGEGLRNIFIKWFWKDAPVTWVMTIFMPFGLYYIVSRGIKQFKDDSSFVISLDALAPALLTGLFTAAALQILPFTATRLTIFIAPFIFYVIIRGIELPKNKFFWFYAVLISIFIFTLLYISTRLIWRYSGEY